jgi:anhydro-N-acetylmuramic acid kinase
MKIDRVLGIMSGTSLDGVDYALCDIGRRGIVLKGLWSVPYPPSLHGALIKAASDQMSSYQVAQLHHDLGRFYAKHAPSIRCDYVGLHGQTIFHNPAPRAPATYQIGEPAYLAARLGVPVVNQFRNMDLALGGQGAPMATLFHREVFSLPKVNVAVNNLGGISNVTFLPARNSRSKLLSFDTGPANILIDYAIKELTKGKKTFDEGGSFAFRGIADDSFVQRWMKHPFFKKVPPKSTGREDFGEEFFKTVWKEMAHAKLSGYDRVATLAEFTAQSLAHAYETFLPAFPQIVILCGGGAANPILVERIRRALRERQWIRSDRNALKVVDVTVSDALGWPSQSIEPAAFGLLAYCTRHSLPGNLPATTGARGSAIGGQITPAPEIS